MKRKIAAFAIVTMFTLGSTFTAFAQEAQATNVQAIEATTETKTTVNGIVLKDEVEKLGYTIAWNSEDSSITITKGDFSTIINVGVNKYIVGGEEVELEFAPFVTEENRVVVPASFLEKVLGVKPATGADILSANWEVVKVINPTTGADITDLNKKFLSLIKFDATTNRYEFFNKDTLRTKRDDLGRFFFSEDGKRIVMLSEHEGYGVKIKNLTKESFEYLTNGVLEIKPSGTVVNGEVAVVSVPYTGKIKFSKELPELVFKSAGEEVNSLELSDKNEENIYKFVTDKLNKDSGDLVITKGVEGSKLLADKKVWDVVQVYGEEGDITQFNPNLLTSFKFDLAHNQYEEYYNGVTRDNKNYGYFDVIQDNRVLTLANTYAEKGRTVELITLKDDRVAFIAMGKDKANEDVAVVVVLKPSANADRYEFTIKQ